MDCEELFVGIVEESNLVRDVHTDGMAYQCFAGCHVPNNELVVVLST